MKRNETANLSKFIAGLWGSFINRRESCFRYINLILESYPNSSYQKTPNVEGHTPDYPPFIEYRM